MTSYFAYAYDDLPEKVKRKALREVRRRYGEILADETRLIDLIRTLHTKFSDDGTVAELIGLPTCFVTDGGLRAATEGKTENSDP